MPPKACDVCFKRKIQCSLPSQGPPCNWCKHHDAECTVTREPQKKRPHAATLDAIRQLQQRIEQLEGERNAQPHVTTPESPVAAGITPRTAAQYSSPVSVYAPSPSANSATTVSASAPRSAPAVEARALRVPGGRIGLNWYFKGMQFLSPRGAQWMTSATGRQVSLDTFKPLDSVLDGFHSATWATQSYGLTVLSELPDERSTHDAVETIYASSIPFCASVLDRVLFQDTIKRAYEVPMDAHSSPFQAPSRACIWALHAIASRLQPRGKQTIHDTETCVNKAQVLINLAAEVSTLETLQAVLLLQTYQAFTRHWPSASFLHPLSCRMVCDLGGHVYQETASAADDNVARQTRHIRHLFWLCYGLDKDIALRSGRPPVLNEEYCDLAQPPSMAGSDAGELSHQLSNDPRLSIIKERTCRLLYSPTSFRISNGQLLHNMRQLDDELEQWRLSIPPLIRPRLAIPAGSPLLPPDASITQSIQCINLQLDYHYTLISIHTAVRRCGAAHENENLPDDLHQVVHSSIDLSLEAGRSTLLFLRAPIEIFKEGALRHISFYAPIAAMVLFLNILIHPFDSRGPSDLELVVAGVSVIHSLPPDALTISETEHLQGITDFIMELSRLGRSAVWKAKNEDSTGTLAHAHAARH